MPEEQAPSNDTGGDPSASSAENGQTQELPARENPQAQRKLYKAIGYKMQTLGDTWYPISMKWFNQWKEYTAYKLRDEDIVGGLANLHLREVPVPGPIANDELADEEDPSQLKKDLTEHLTHEWIHSEQWDLLHGIFGGGPAFPRKVYERGSYTKEAYINTYPRFLKVVECDKEGKYNLEKAQLHSFPQEYTFRQVIEQFEQDGPENDDNSGLSGNPDEATGNNDDPDLATGGADSDDDDEDTKDTVHLWIPFGVIKHLYPISNTHKKDPAKHVVVKDEELADEDDKRYVEIPDDSLKQKLDELEMARDTIIVVERKGKKGKWPLAKSEEEMKPLQVGDIIDAQDNQTKWYQAFVRLAPTEEEHPHKDQVCCHFIGWATKWDEWVPNDESRIAFRQTKTTGPHRPRPQKNRYGGSSSRYTGGGGGGWSYYAHDTGAPDQRGVVGLRNLGNTCFMNSTIQCLAQSPKLTSYFLNNEFVHHINRNNPLGWKGRVAEAWAKLLKDMFSDKYRVLAPREFKSAIGEVAPRFTGYAQQDSQELLSFLLDGLHEDLNQIIDKPATETVESNGRPDHIVAKESWKQYLRRNQSEIVDLLQGQYKSRVECPDCDRISITFDPYMFLSVPLPTEKHKIVEFTWVSGDTSVLPKVYGIKMLKFATMNMLKKEVAKKFDVNKDEIFVCDVWKSKIHRDMRGTDMVNDISARNDDIFIYHSPKRLLPEDDGDDDGDGGAETGDGGGDSPDKGDKDADGDSAMKEAPAGSSPENDGNDNDNGNDNDAGGDNGNDNDAGGAGAGGAGTGAGTGGAGSRRTSSSARGPLMKTFIVAPMTKVQVKSNYYYDSRVREEDEHIGIPLLITLPMARDVTRNEARQMIFDMVKPYLRNQELTLEDELPFGFYCTYGFNTAFKMDAGDEALPLDERNFKFVVHFEDREQYLEELYPRADRPRDESAPEKVDRSRYYRDDDSRGGKPVSLEACIDAFTEEEILDENDAWYCSVCKAFKCAQKQISLYNCPDLLIIHLKRFSYTRQWRDRINTLVKFPLTGLDLSKYVVDPDSAKDAIYDLYAISNHMGGMGGGHYTAYAKNLENKQWYQLDDSRTSPVRDPSSMISSAAYVLYYYRQNPKELKQRASRVFSPEEIAAMQEKKAKARQSVTEADT